MANRGNKLGDAYVEIRGDTQSLPQDLQKARTEVERQTAEMGAAVDRNVGGGFLSAGKKIEQSTEGVRKLQGAVSSVAGVFTGMLGTIALIGTGVTAIVAGVKAWYEFQSKAANEASRQARNYEELAATIEDQRMALAGVADETRIVYELHRDWSKEVDKLRDSLREGQISGEQYRRLVEDSWDVLNQKAEQQRVEIAKTSEAYQLFLQGIENMKRAAKEAADEQDRLNDKWRETFQFISEFRSPETLGPPREAWEEAGKKAAEAYTRAFDQIAGNQSAGLGNLSGTIETLAARMEAAIEASSFSSSRRQS